MATQLCLDPGTESNLSSLPFPQGDLALWVVSAINENWVLLVDRAHALTVPRQIGAERSSLKARK